MKRALLCTLIAAALLLSACTRASESTVRAPDAGAPLTLCLGAGPAALDPARTENGVGATYVVNLFAGLTGYRAGGDGKAELTPELCAALDAYRLVPKRIRPVHSRMAEGALLVLLEARRNGKPGLKWEPPVYLEESKEPGNF